MLCYLLDTNDISEPIRLAPHAAVLARLQQHDWTLSEDWRSWYDQASTKYLVSVEVEESTSRCRVSIPVASRFATFTSNLRPA